MAGSCPKISRTPAQRRTPRGAPSARGSCRRTARNISRSASSLASATRSPPSCGRTRMMRRPIRGTPTRPSTDRARGRRISGWRRDAPPTTNSEEASRSSILARPRSVPHNPRSGLHNPVMLPYRLWPPLRFAGKGEKERRDLVPRRLSRPRPQRGFSSAQLLPAVAVVVAGRHQGGLSRAGEHRRPVRPRSAQPEPGDEAPQRGFAQDLREARDAARLHPLQRVPARQVQLPVLRLARGSHLRSSIAALARRTHDLDQRGRRLLALQSQEGQSDDGRSQDVAVADAVPTERQSLAPQRPALSAQLPARELARLSLLGQRASAVSAVAASRPTLCARLSRLPCARRTAQGAFAATPTRIHLN